MNLTIGCDPEVFLRNPNSNEFVSAVGLLPGDKARPFRVPFGAVQVDGLAAEFNIDPAETEDEFVYNINTVYTRLEEMIPAYRLEKLPVADFTEEYFKTLSPESQVLGCNPDFNAWTSLENDPPKGSVPFRTAAGHVHIGWDKGLDENSGRHFLDCCEIVRQLDYYLGVYTLLWDTDNRRRSMYGKAGAFRPKSYGVEYRVPSNAWLKSDSLMRWVFRSCQKAVIDLAEGKNLPEIFERKAQRIIDEEDYDWLNTTGIHDATGLELPPVPGVENLRDVA